MGIRSFDLDDDSIFEDYICTPGMNGWGVRTLDVCFTVLWMGKASYVVSWLKDCYLIASRNSLFHRFLCFEVAVAISHTKILSGVVGREADQRL